MFTEWHHNLAGSLHLGKGPQPEAPLASAAAEEKLCGAAVSITALLSTSWPCPPQAQLCLAVKPESIVSCVQQV